MAGEQPGQGRRSPLSVPHLSGSEPRACEETIVPAAQAGFSVRPTKLRWVAVAPGPDCAALLWSATLVTYGHLGHEPVGLPLTRVTLAEAADIAALLGGRLPTSAEWEWMAAGPQRHRYPWGNGEWTAERANLRGSGIGEPTPVGQCPAGATPDGLLDVAVNVWEWTSTLVFGGAVIRGGSYNSLPAYARSAYANAAPFDLRSPGLGLRVARSP